MWPNTDAILQADYDRYQNSIADIDEVIETPTSNCKNCGAEIDIDEKFCDSECWWSDFCHTFTEILYKNRKK